MSPSKVGAICVGTAALPLLAIAIVGWSGPAAFQRAPSDEAATAGTVGGNRNLYLAELTQFYMTRDEAVVSDGMRAGTELAPTPFLNRELEQRRVKWRVRTTTGLDARTYDVS